jgi:hypothetical protein
VAELDRDSPNAGLAHARRDPRGLLLAADRARLGKARREQVEVGEGRRDAVPAAGRVEGRVEGGEDAPAPRFPQESSRRLPVEGGQHERPCDVQRTGREEATAVGLVGSDGRARAEEMEERPLPIRRDEHDRRGGRDGRVPRDKLAVETPLVEEPEQKIAECVGADLARDGHGEAEAGENRSGVERAAAAAQLDLVQEAERAALREALHGPRDHVRHDDPEADDVGRGGHAMWISTSSATPPRIV